MAADDWTHGLGWGRFEEQQFRDIGHFGDEAVFQDDDLKNAYDIGWFNEDVDHDYRVAAREFVIEWLAGEYGIEFDAVFDWDEWRERYAGG